MFNISDIVVYKGHGLVRVVGIPKKKLGDVVESYYMLKSQRSPLSQTKLLVKTSGAEEVLRYPVSPEVAEEIREVLGGEAAELPEDPRERMEIIDEVMRRNDVKELASLVRDYRETKLGNLERPEIKRIKAISRNIAEELCHSLKINRSALRGKLFVRSA